MSRRLLLIAGLLSVLLAPCPVWAGKSVDSYPLAARQHFVQAEKLREQQKYREAAASYNEAIRMGMGDCAEIYLPLAECYRKLNEHALAVATCTRLIEEFDQTTACRNCLLEAHRGRAAALEALGKREQALGDLSTLILFCEQELGVRKELKDRNLGTILEETARADRERARLLADLGRRTAAQADRDRAGDLETETRQLASTSGTSGSGVQQDSAKPTEKIGWVSPVQYLDRPGDHRSRWGVLHPEAG